MEREIYTLAARIEEDHWWFRGRRAVLRSVLNRYAPRKDGPLAIFEVGCGNGGNLPLLAAYGRVSAVEWDDAARDRAAQRGLARVEKGRLPEELPFCEEQFDLIATLDVLEHVDEDQRALATLRNRLRPGGVLLLTVPAYQWLWSPHDDQSHHKRRYRHSQCLAMIRNAGLTCQYSTYFNTLLFPLAVLHLTLGRYLTRGPQTALAIPPFGLNRMLTGIFAMERLFVPPLRFPFGLSILACATRAE